MVGGRQADHYFCHTELILFGNYNSYLRPIYLLYGMFSYCIALVCEDNVKKV